MKSALFSPVKFRSMTVPNRIAVAPMCQYSARDGCMTDWHLMHLGQFAVSGAGLVMTEMTNVAPEGRIGPYCLGLYSDACETAMRRVVEFCRKYGTARLGLQLAHAGRKSSILPPWEGRRALMPLEGGWRPVGPSAVAVSPEQLPPKELDQHGLAELKQKFVDAVRRAIRIGFDVIELHAAHGYLVHQFLSPISNRRTDVYGGSAEKRMRFPLELFQAMRAEWPSERPMAVKLSVLDWCEGGWTMSESIELCGRLRDLGCDYVVVSTGGIVWSEKIPAAPGFQVKYAEEIRRKTGMPVVAVGLITKPNQAEQIVRSGDVDMVALARGMLWDPRWAWHAADALEVDLELPNQYARARPQLAHDTFAVVDGSRKGPTTPTTVSQG